MNQRDAMFMEFGDLAGEMDGGAAGEWGFQETGFTLPEVPLQELGLSEFPGQEAAEPETLFSEEEELALASELLEITTEAELDQFIGKLFRRVGRFFRGPVGRFLGGALKRVAKVALPIAGRVVGGMVGGPVGAMAGGALAQTAGRIFGLELEGLSPEDQEFEVARRFVRFAGNAIARAARHPVTRAGVQAALREAARRYAPGLLRPVGDRPGAAPEGPPSPLAGRSGRWVRRGNRIILFGV